MAVGAAFDDIESAVGRKLTIDELNMATRLYVAGKSVEYIVSTILDIAPEPAAPREVAYVMAGNEAAELAATGVSRGLDDDDLDTLRALAEKDAE